MVKLFVAAGLLALAAPVEADVSSGPTLTLTRLQGGSDGVGAVSFVGSPATDSTRTGTGLHALEHFADVLHASGRTLILCGMRDQPARMMERAEFHEHIGEANLTPTIADALRRAQAVLHDTDGLTPAA